MTKSPFFYTSLSLFLILGLIISIYVFGWTTPTANPPSNNIPPPLNTGSSKQTKTGYLAIGTSTSPTYPLEVGNQLRVWGQIISKVASGTAPIIVDSPTKIANLNSDLLDGYDSADLLGGGTVWGYGPPPGNCAPYKDCDGDGYSAFTGDCDETCPTCYIGSTAYTTSPDGKDQDCDGVVDERTLISCTPSYGTPVLYGFDEACVWTTSGPYYYTPNGSNPVPKDTTHCQPAGDVCTDFVGGYYCSFKTTSLAVGPYTTCNSAYWYSTSTPSTTKTVWYVECAPMTGCTASYKYY
ncbi:MAG: hypothetical protein ACP5OX_00850 [Minisyncoccia bacterium]